MFEILKGCKFCQRAFLNYSQKTNLTNLCIVSSEDAIEYWSLTLYLHLIRIHNNGIFLYSVSGLSQIWWKFIRCNFFKSTLVCRIFRYFSRLRKAYKWFEKGAENENIVVFFCILDLHMHEADVCSISDTSYLVCSISAPFYSHLPHGVRSK